MVLITNVRVLQWVLAAVVLGLAAKQTHDKSTLTTLVADVNSLSNSINITELLSLQKRDSDSDNLVLQLDKKGSVVAMVSSSYNLLSHPVLSLAPSSFSSKTISSSSSSSSSSGLTWREKWYLGGITGSELGLHVVYFFQFIYDVAAYGHYDCGAAVELLQEYNLTGAIDDEIMSNFYGIDDTDVVGNGTWQLGWNNLTSLEKQTELLFALSDDCQLKKASIAMASLLWVLFLFSSSNVALSGYNLYKAWKDEDEEHTLVYNRNLLFPSSVSTKAQEMPVSI